MNQQFGRLSLRYEKERDLWLFCEGEADFWQMKGPLMETEDGEKLPLSELSTVEAEKFSRGRGEGITVHYTLRGKRERFSCRIVKFYGEEGFLAEWWAEEPEISAGRVKRFIWPRPSSLEEAFTVLPWEQGQLIPFYWPEEISRPPFDGQFCTAGAYMPWIGQTNRRGEAWQMIAETPWDGGYSFRHPAGGPTTDAAFYWMPSLGAWRYPRKTRIYLRTPSLNFLGPEADSSPDYNHLAKRYRRYAKERGIYTSLEEKAVRNPHVRNLIGAAVIHLGIKSHTEPESRFYKEGRPELNDAMISFSERRKQMEGLHALHAPKYYLHLDGWGDAGYDNCHPDYLPVCREAGGEKDLLALVDTVQRAGNLFGLHDQYRDYYVKAESFNREEAVTNADGTNTEHANWAGGRQTYLCASLAGHYVKRNFESLFAAGIHPDCSYLDVFTCNEPDECFHPEHPMSRRDCLTARLECFAWLTSQGIVPSSEEMNDWALRELVFCHYAPYSFMLDRPGSPRNGLPIPLWNLVYHDASMVPWPTDKADDTHEDYLLYALLNAGMPYLVREGAYPGTDGAFGDRTEAVEELKSSVARAREACALQEKLAFTELLEHRFLSSDGKRQECLYADGTLVSIDTENGSYVISSEIDKASGNI